MIKHLKLQKIQIMTYIHVDLLQWLNETSGKWTEASATSASNQDSTHELHKPITENLILWTYVIKDLRSHSSQSLELKEDREKKWWTVCQMNKIW